MNTKGGYCRRDLKEAAKQSVKSHYIFFVVVCIFASLLGASFSNAFNFLKRENNSIYSTSTANGAVVSQGKRTQVIEELLHGDEGRAEKIASQTEKEEKQSGEGSLGRSRGVLAFLVNSIASGTAIVTMVNAISSLVDPLM